MICHSCLSVRDAVFIHISFVFVPCTCEHLVFIHISFAETFCRVCNETRPNDDMIMEYQDRGLHAAIVIVAEDVMNCSWRRNGHRVIKCRNRVGCSPCGLLAVMVAVPAFQHIVPLFTNLPD